MSDKPPVDLSADLHAVSASTLASRPSARARARSSTRPEADDSPRSASITPSMRTPATPSISVRSEATLAAVLLGDEVTRAHGFSGSIGAMATLVLVALPLLGGDEGAKLLCAITLVVIAAASLWVFVSTRAGRDYSRRLHRAYGLTISTGVILVENYFGYLSAALVVVTLGIYYLGQSSDALQARLLPGYVIASFASLAALTSFGVLEDRGLLTAGTQVARSSQLLVIVAICALFVLTQRLARMSRASMRAAIERSNEAMLMAQRREALLIEAQQHLERALGVAVGQPGQSTGRLAGAYKLEVVIGVGAMGEVYAAEHVVSGQRAAVKLLQPKARERPDLVERFLREAQICQQLRSPYLARVYDVGTLDDGAPYLAMELLSGRDLSALLRREKSLPLAAVVDLACALAEGLTHAHEAGVVHRDLKPVNVFQAQDPNGARRWKILDFGISKQRGGTGTLTDVGIVGTPSYMSPEQARGQVVDLRSDLFSMAVVLYRALTGRPAFTGSDTPQIMFEVVYQTPERPSAMVKRLPGDVDLVFAIALAKDPAHRFPSARELAHALVLAAQHKLGDELRVRGQAAVRAYPWGQTTSALAVQTKDQVNRQIRRSARLVEHEQEQGAGDEA